jgi:hypothetical protein
MYATKWREIGVFNRDSGTYSVERIPKPPEAKVRFEQDPYGRQSHIGYELKVQCSKCFDQIIVRWDKRYSDTAVNGVRDFGDPELAAVALLNEVTAAKRMVESQLQGSRQREAETAVNLKRVLLKLERLKRSKRTKRTKRERKARKGVR